MEVRPAPSKRDALAMAIMAQRQDAANERVPQSGGRVPLVCIDIEYLLGKLEADRPIICFLSLSVFPHRISSVGGLARHFLSALREIRPEGPCHLTGYCFGAMVALEMARLLEEDGQEVSTLIMLEPMYAGGPPPLRLRAAHRLRKIAQDLGTIASFFRSKVSRAPRQAAPGGQVPPEDEFQAELDDAIAAHAFRPYSGTAIIVVGADSDCRFIIDGARWRPFVGGAQVRFTSGDHGERFFSENLVTVVRDALDR